VRLNHRWDAMCRCYRYPSGEISVTEEAMYASGESMREWAAVALCAALALLVWGEQA